MGLNTRVKIASEARCLYDVLRELSLEFEIPERSDINQINRCQLYKCSGRESHRNCYKPCNYDPNYLKSDFRKALVKDEIKKRKKNGTIKPASPRIVFSDVSNLCGDPVIDRFSNSGYRQIDRIYDSGEDD